MHCNGKICTEQKCCAIKAGVRWFLIVAQVVILCYDELECWIYYIFAGSKLLCGGNGENGSQRNKVSFYS